MPSLKNFRYFDTPASGDVNKGTYVPSKQGLFSALGSLLTNVAVGYESPTSLATLQLKAKESEDQFQQYLAQQKQRQEELDIKRQDSLANQRLQPLMIKVLSGQQLTPEDLSLLGPAGNAQPAANPNMPQPSPALPISPNMGITGFNMGKRGVNLSIGTIPQTPEQKQQMELETAALKNDLPTADMKNASISIGQAKSLLEDLKSQASSLKGGYAGMGEIGKAILNRGAGESGDYKLYTDNLPSAAITFYRSVTGDTRLSDADAKARALPIMWHPSEDVSLKEKKFGFAERMLTAREKLLQSGKYKDGVIPFDVLKQEASKSVKSSGKEIKLPSGKTIILGGN